MQTPDAKEVLFISYAPPDERWAEWIGWQLETQSYRVRLHKWDARPGTNFVVEMQAATKANRTVGVLSPAYLDSDLGGAEWAAALRHDPVGKLRKLVLVRVQKCDPTGLLATNPYVDLVGKNEDEARTILLAGVRNGRDKPTRSPTFPGLSCADVATSYLQPAFPTALSKIWTVPFRRNPYFIGRERELDELCESFETNGFTMVVCVGLPGVGKTQLAAEYALSQSARYDAVLWVAADSEASLSTNLASLGRKTALNLHDLESDSETSRLQGVVDWLKTRERWLLIFDNVDTDEAADAINRLLLEVPTGHVLVTSQTNTEWGIAVTLLEVCEFPEPTAAAFLRKRTQQVRAASTENERDARAICEKLAGLPLALEQAAAYMANQRVGLSDYLVRLCAKSSEILDFRTQGATAYKKTTFSAFPLTETKLEPEARTVLRLIAFYAAEPVPRNIFEVGKQVFGEALATMTPAASSAVDSARAAERGLIQLADYSLLTLNSTNFSCHRLLMTVQREQLTASERRTWLGLALRLFDTAMPRGGESAQVSERWERMQTHASELIQHAKVLGISRHCICLMTDRARLLKSKGHLVEARRLFRRALRIREASPDCGSSELLERIDELSSVLLELRDFERAVPLLSRALQLDETRQGTGHPDLVCRLRTLAEVLENCDRLQEGEPLLRRALAIDELNLGDQHPDVARGLSGLATLLFSTGRGQQAEPLFRRALEIDQSVFGTEHEEVATHLNNLAFVLKENEQFDEAKALMRRAVAIDESMGTWSPAAAMRLTNLGSLLRTDGALDEAVNLFRRALEIKERSCGVQHADLVNDLYNLADVLHDQQQFDESKELYRRAYDLSITDVLLRPL